MRSLNAFASSWRVFQRRQMDDLKVLLVCEEPATGPFQTNPLQGLLRDLGIEASVTHALPRVEQHVAAQPWDLVIVGETGANENLQLFRQFRPHVRTLVLSKSDPPEVHSADDYLCLEAASNQELQSRILSLLDQAIAANFFDVVINDLCKAVHHGTKPSTAMIHLTRTLLQEKKTLGELPMLGLVGPAHAVNDVRAELVAQEVSAITVDLQNLRSLLHTRESPLVIGLHQPPSANIAPLVGEIHETDPTVEIMVLRDSDCDVSLELLFQAGASEWGTVGGCRQQNAQTVRRIHRLASQARRHRLYLKTVEILDAAAHEVRNDLDEEVVLNQKERRC